MTTSMSRDTGEEISGDAYDDECVDDLLTTPLGTSPMRLEYGWTGQEIIDAPLHPTGTNLLLTSAAAMAMRRWLPDIKLRKVTLDGAFADGTATLTVARQRPGPSTSLTDQTIPLSR